MGFRRQRRVRDEPELQKSRQWSTCEAHGKRSYFSRKQAKKACKRAELTGGGHMREYACEAPGQDAWHIGHVPSRVLVGDHTAREIYGKKRKGKR